MDTNTIIELRQYTMQPGQRETLIAIFERHFIEAQEALGMTVFGQFRDRVRADRFVFLRGFPDMASRQHSLERFYDGDVWAAQRDAANATMIDWHDVLLLRPARPETAFDVSASDRASAAAADAAADESRRLVDVLQRIDALTALAREHEPLIVLALEPTSRSRLGHQAGPALKAGTAL